MRISAHCRIQYRGVLTLNKNLMNYSIFKSRTFWTVLTLMAYNDVALATPYLHGGTGLIATLFFNFLGMILVNYFHVNPSQSYTSSSSESL